MTASATSSDDLPPLANLPETDAAARRRRTEVILEIIALILLGVGTLATSWSGYQATRWGGVQATAYSEANVLRIESIRATNGAGQQRIIDVVLFGNWLEAYSTNNQALADFYKKRFRAEFIPAFDAWIASNPRENPNAALSPFELPEYVQALEVEAAEYDRRSTDTFFEGQQANQRGDNYVLNAVLLASVLFLAGVSQRFTVLPIRIALIAGATALCLIGLYNVATFPIW
jgi:hypothetical protein